MHSIGTQVLCWTIPEYGEISSEYLDESTLSAHGIAIPMNPSPHRPFLARPDSMAAQISRNAMEPGIFRLEKPVEWQLRRPSYPRRGPVWWWSRLEVQEFRVKDSMDEADYDESTAFPLLKPNIEVFGLPPPATLRRQRGWHQRKRWPPTEGKEVVRWTGGATGAEVPQELFDKILSPLNAGEYISKVEASKRELGQISLVCRRWAKLIRPRIFEEIQLRNRDDADTLLSFLRCPTSVISGYIESLPLQLSVASYPYLPWVHTVCDVIHPRFAKKPPLELKIEGPLPANKVMKGVHEMLPRSYPYFSSELRKLSLDDIQFKSFGHLMNTIGEMPALERVELQKVTWNHRQDEEFRPPPARRAKFQQHPVYNMQECTDDAAVIWLQLLLVLPGSDRLDELDADRLYRIISHLARGRQHVECVYGRSLGPDVFMITVQRLSGGGQLYVHVFLTSHVEGQSRHIRAIAFDSRVWQGSVDVDWKEVDNLIASLSALHTLVFLFRHMDDVLPVHRDIIAQNMAHFKDSHKLKYALESNFKSDDVWTRVACADDGTIKEIGPRYKGSNAWKQLV